MVSQKERKNKKFSQGFFMRYLNGELKKEEISKLTKNDLLNLYKRYAGREREIVAMTPFKIIKWMAKS